MDTLFQSHTLNGAGKAKAIEISEHFDALLKSIAPFCPASREFSICRTKLEEACFYAKKSMASQPENQQQDTAVPTSAAF